MWRSISAPTSYLQIVPEYSEEEAKAKAEKEKAERVESENTESEQEKIQGIWRWEV